MKALGTSPDDLVYPHDYQRKHNKDFQMRYAQEKAAGKEFPGGIRIRTFDDGIIRPEFDEDSDFEMVERPKGGFYILHKPMGLGNVEWRLVPNKETGKMVMDFFHYSSKEVTRNMPVTQSYGGETWNTGDTYAERSTVVTWLKLAQIPTDIPIEQKPMPPQSTLDYDSRRFNPLLKFSDNASLELLNKDVYSLRKQYDQDRSGIEVIDNQTGRVVTIRKHFEYDMNDPSNSKIILYEQGISGTIGEDPLIREANLMKPREYRIGESKNPPVFDASGKMTEYDFYYG